ncbi:MAG: LPS export ABC transporter permease LptF [Gammaproteobacteria bacterium]|nr:LPS export ABC transporter permease LptF [Pseudomonadales bacterium]MCP5346702.1 LPS export ABC transporter permease LptF [Pseudomonadales bacterium]
MIIFRYLTRQVLSVMTAVTLILLVVGLINRFILYLTQAVAGQMSPNVLLLLVFYRLPDFLLVILPLALFLAILLAYGRMYAENEMTVLIASGLSRWRLLALTSGSSLVVVLLVSVLSLLLAPWGIRNTEQLKLQQEQLTEVDLITAGQFQEFNDGERITYAERIGSDPSGRRLENVFVVSRPAVDSGRSAIRILISDTARPEVDPQTGARFMRLENVMQYQGEPGSADFTIGEFDVQAILLPEPARFEEIDQERAFRTSSLLGSAEPARQAELQWRISSILIIPIVTLIAVPLSRVSPRQGRYGKLVPAAMIYAVYFMLLQVSQDQLAEGDLPAVVGLWWVHVLFLALGLAIYRKTGTRSRRRLRRSKAGT